MAHDPSGVTATEADIAAQLNEELIEATLSEPFDIRDVAAQIGRFPEHPLDAEALRILDEWLQARHQVGLRQLRPGAPPSPSRLYYRRVEELMMLGLAHAEAWRRVKERFGLADDVDNLVRQHRRAMPPDVKEGLRLARQIDIG